MNRRIFTSLKVIFASLALLFLCAGCTSEISLELKKDGSVDVQFSGLAGKAFATMINSVSGNSSASSTVLFDTKEIEYEMSSNGFSQVKALSKKGSDLTVTMTDKNGKSALFTSGVVTVKDGKLNASLSPQSLVKFYKSADSQTVQFLDLLLAPIFNDEVMTQEEYVEVLASFYGDEIAEEMKNSSFRITLKNPDGTKTVQNIGFTKLLTLNEVLRF